MCMGSNVTHQHAFLATVPGRLMVSARGRDRLLAGQTAARGYLNGVAGSTTVLGDAFNARRMAFWGGAATADRHSQHCGSAGTNGQPIARLPPQRDRDAP